MNEVDDLQWHALNYRTAGTLQAEEMWQALSACVARMVAAERERCSARAIEAINTNVSGDVARLIELVRIAVLADGPNPEITGPVRLIDR